jgi:hypothetical protein
MISLTSVAEQNVALFCRGLSVWRQYIPNARGELKQRCCPKLFVPPTGLECTVVFSGGNESKLTLYQL